MAELIFPQIQQPDIGNALMKAYQIKAFKQQADEAQRKTDTQNALRDAFKSGGYVMGGGVDQQGLRDIAAADPATGLSFMEKESSLAKSTLETQQKQSEARAKKLETGGKVLGALLTLPENERAAAYPVARSMYLQVHPEDEQAIPLDYDPAYVHQAAASVFGGDMMKQAGEAPKTRSIQRGQMNVDQEWDRKSGAWRDVGSGPKFKQTPDSVTTVKVDNRDLVKTSGEVRKEFNSLPQVKAFDEVNDQYARLESAAEEARKTGNMTAVDQSLVTVFNKMLDPTSVVREGEYARTIENSPLLNRIKGKMEAVTKGGAGFTDEERQAVFSMARRFHQDAKNSFDTAADQYGNMIERQTSDIRRDDIVLPRKSARGVQGFDQPPPSQPKPAPSTAQGGGYPEGTRLQGPGGKVFVVRNGQPVPE